MTTVSTNFHEVSKTHPLWEHEFLRRCRDGELTRPQLEHLAVQMHAFCSEFHGILQCVWACCPDVDAQVVILENIHDEQGMGDDRLAHPALFRRFTRALGIDDAALAAAPVEPETRALVETYMSLPARYGYVAALGAICFASEGIVGALYTQLLEGIAGVESFSSEALSFFEVHVEVDDGHAAQLAALVEPRVCSDEDAMRVRAAIATALDARCRFFDGVQRVSSATTRQVSAA